MDGIIFDVDGTLWDSTKIVARAWNLAIEETTDLSLRVTANQLKGLFGKPLEAIIEALFPTLEETKKKALMQSCFEYEHAFLAKECGYLYEGMAEGIKELSKKYQLFIVSNCQAGYIETFLKATNLGGYITDFTCPGITKLLKGDNLKLIMKRNQLQSAIYVGDTQGDADACKIAGIPMIYASYGFGSVEKPDYQIASFGELLDFDFTSIS
ncbi:phosphoglycolate phosphatase [Lachnotalea glycerini]|uniref:HAD family hydrolase n=1 Tax=Lachnotalea glycerini TaxID=1763509 RepID=A0A318ES00_9FIRM|nr:HAD family hydrolase [Lachnotalea glycerini]PXV91129.1 phosphoglycolate phosphatase [Lachnotalea glycerini]RDY31165.1 HAD family hydrolase [Lachnotalea glycerini]